MSFHSHVEVAELANEGWAANCRYWVLSLAEELAAGNYSFSVIHNADHQVDVGQVLQLCARHQDLISTHDNMLYHIVDHPEWVDSSAWSNSLLPSEVLWLISSWVCHTCPLCLRNTVCCPWSSLSSWLFFFSSLFHLLILILNCCHNHFHLMTHHHCYPPLILNHRRLYQTCLFARLLLQLCQSHQVRMALTSLEQDCELECDFPTWHAEA